MAEDFTRIVNDSVFVAVEFKKAQDVFAVALITLLARTQ
jgi:hypothetical protein